MKKIFLLALATVSIVCVNTKADAQFNVPTVKTEKLTKTSVSGTDTSIAVAAIDKGVTSIEAVANKTSGTVAGKVYLVGIDLKGTNKVRLDSLTVTNTTGDQWKLFSIPDRSPYKSYEVHFISTSGTWSVAAYKSRWP